MKRGRALVVAALCAGASGCTPAAAAVSPPPALSARTFIGGIQVNEPDHAAWTKALADFGFNTVSATVYAKQGNWDEAHLWWSPSEPAVEAEIRAAKAAGLKVVLILRVALDHAFERNRFLWHGMIHPRGPEAVDAWFDRYEAFVLEWSQRAQALGVDVLGVGSELSSLTSTRPLTRTPGLIQYYLDPAAQARLRDILLAHRDRIRPEHWHALGGGGYGDLESFLRARSAVWRGWAELVVGVGDEQVRLRRMNARRAHLERRWRRLLERVRQVYAGPLTYAANFDQYEEVGFWDALDVLGINAYFPLRDPSRPPGDLEAELTQGWRGVLGDIEDLRRRKGLDDLPVLFTELGYTQHRDATFEPWAQQGLSVLGPPDARRLYIWQEQPMAPEERAAAVRALDRAQSERAGLLAGALYWKLSTRWYHRDIEPFVLLLEEDAKDPLLDALRAFGH